MLHDIYEPRVNISILNLGFKYRNVDLIFQRNILIAGEKGLYKRRLLLITHNCRVVD